MQQKLDDLKETRLAEFSQNRQSIIMDSLGLIVWIRDAPNLLRPYQLQLLKLNQLRLYLASCKNVAMQPWWMSPSTCTTRSCPFTSTGEISSF